MLARGATIGLIGGGQLGRMLAMAAARLGFRTVVLDPDANCPAAQVCNLHVIAAFDDPHGLQRLAETSDVITFEFENVDADAIDRLVGETPVHPSTAVLRISQDRLVEKRFLNDAGLATAPFEDCPDSTALQAALFRFGGSGILKTRRFGYDGKGQVRFAGNHSDPSPGEALSMLNDAPAILEGFIDFSCEISVIVTRGQDGTTVCFEPARNVHRDGILATSTVPAGLGPDVEAAAISAAKRLADRLGYVGTLGLEFFVASDGALLANEFAPRVHNSGHWTEAAATISQFEMHVRAIAGWPLPQPMRHSDCVMENLIGDAILALPEHADNPNCVIHDYGKAEARAGRKMGHVTAIRAKSAI